MRRQLLRDLAPQLVEDRVLVRDILLPVGSVELRSTQFLRDEGVPRLERQTALGIVDAHAEQRHEYQRTDRGTSNLGGADELSGHFNFPEAIAANISPV